MKILMIGNYFNEKNINKSHFKNMKIQIDYASMANISHIESRVNDYNLYFIDVEPNNFAWIPFVKFIRSFSFTPIVIAVEKIQYNTQLTALDLDVTWFILKPFQPDFLVRVIKKFFSDYKNYYNIRDFYFYKESRSILINQERIPLTNKEYGLLAFLIENKNIALYREQILDKVWGAGNGSIRLLDFHIKNLRKKLNSYSYCIVTLNGIGYSWQDNNTG